MSAATRPSPGDFDGLGFHVRLEFQCDPGQIANQVLIERVGLFVAIESNDGGLAFAFYCDDFRFHRYHSPENESFIVRVD